MGYVEMIMAAIALGGEVALRAQRLAEVLNDEGHITQAEFDTIDQEYQQSNENIDDYVDGELGGGAAADDDDDD